MNSHETSAIAFLQKMLDSNLLSESLTQDCLYEIRSLQRGVQKNARLLEALKTIESYDEGNGCCPYGCDCPTIAEIAIAEAEVTVQTPPKSDKPDSFMQRFDSPESGRRLDSMIQKVDAMLSRLNNKETP